MLTDAWKLYASYDYNARLQQKNFRRYQGTLLLLALATTLLATLLTAISTSKPPSAPTQTAAQKSAPSQAASSQTATDGSEVRSPLEHFLTAAIVLITATTSGLLSAMSRYKPGEKWLTLRANAQIAHREIFTYLMQAGEYRDHLEPNLLYSKLNALSTGMSDIILHELPPENAAAVSAEAFPMTSDQYITLRLHDQSAYYHSRIGKLNWQAQWLHGASIVSGTAGTVLALLHFSLWIPLTTALTTACISYLQQRQIEVTLAQFNQSYNSLECVHRWWNNELTDEGRALPGNRDKLVSFTEDILAAELTSWTQKLSEAMAKMTASVPAEDERGVAVKRGSIPTSPEAQAVVRS